VLKGFAKPVSAFNVLGLRPPGLPTA